MRRPLPRYGVAGLVIVGAAELLLVARWPPVATFFTPIVWTGYILFVDGVVLARTGRSQLSSDRGEFLRVALLSIPIWLLFEAYNLRLKNWEYVGLPESAPFRLLGYGWSFATILPGIFETSDLLLSFGIGRSREAAARRPPAPHGYDESFLGSPGTRVSLILFGGLCLVLPLVAMPAVAPYLFGLVWIGFVFLLEPINTSLHRWAPFLSWSRGERGRFVTLLAGGLVCGVLWEFWNYWAGAKWIYVFPILQNAKLFEMPVPGFLGFPPFAVECFLIYELVSTPWSGGWGRRTAAGARGRSFTNCAAK